MEAMVAGRPQSAKLAASPLGRLFFGGEADVEADLREVSGQRFRIHRPRGVAGPLPVVVHFHGGGFCVGAPEQSRWIASHVAEAGYLVVSPSYRLAPEHVYPAAPDDCWTALEWVRANAASLGGDPERIALMGDSAGGTLAAVTSIAARDAGRPVQAQVLIYPAVEMYEKFPSELENADGPILTSEQMSLFAHTYLADSYGKEDWRASPLRAESHADLPPAFILTAQHDPLRDHGPKYAEALTAAGSSAELRNYRAAVHGFITFPHFVPEAKDALADIVAFLRRTL